MIDHDSAYAVVPLIVSAVVAALIAPGALRAFVEAGWTRANYRGADLPFPAGVVAVVAGILAAGSLAAVQELLGDELGEVLIAADLTTGMGLCLGVAFLGLLDDVFDAPARGWRGHAAALLRGGFSTGALKAAGTLALALWALSSFGLADDANEYVLAVSVIVLSTNLFNLLDLRPGRAAKVFALLGAGLLVGTGELAPLRAVGPFAGALLVLGLYDLRERAMLGDTGSNLLGALAGIWIVAALDTTGQAVALGVLLALTIFGEFRSISATIERIPPLKALDSLGRPG